MTFSIDTGTQDGLHRVGAIDYCQAMQDAATDAAWPETDVAIIAAELARLIVLDLTAPKRADTARAHFARYWPLIAPMAYDAPASYDHIIQEFAERLAELR
jgi:NADPH-dependent ferric siderophore reductase